MPGSELAICSSSVPWLRITHRGSDCVVPLGSNKTTWNFLKSVDPISWFIGQGSSASGILSLSKSSKHASPLPSPARERDRNKERDAEHVISWIHLCQDEGKKKRTSRRDNVQMFVRGNRMMVDGLKSLLCMINHATEGHKRFMLMSNVYMTWISGDITGQFVTRV